MKKRNGLNTNTVEIGQQLFLPETNRIDDSKISEKPINKVIIKDSPNASYHVVLAGETLYRISVKYNISVDKLKQLNNLPDNTISVGQKIILKK